MSLIINQKLTNKIMKDYSEGKFILKDTTWKRLDDVDSKLYNQEATTSREKGFVERLYRSLYNDDGTVKRAESGDTQGSEPGQD